MNSLEQEVAQFLTHLITGKPVSLDDQQKIRLSQWISMKCMVLEHLSGRDLSVTTYKDRQDFKKSLKIPTYYKIYVGNRLGETDMMYSRTSIMLTDLTLIPDPPLDDSPNNIQTIAFVIGRLFVYHVAARIKDFDYERKVRIPWLFDNGRLWPLGNGTMSWPRWPNFSDQDTAAIVASFTQYLAACKLHWDKGKPTPY